MWAPERRTGDVLYSFSIETGVDLFGGKVEEWGGGGRSIGMSSVLSGGAVFLGGILELGIICPIERGET